MRISGKSSRLRFRRYRRPLPNGEHEGAAPRADRGRKQDRRSRSFKVLFGEFLSLLKGHRATLALTLGSLSCRPELVVRVVTVALTLTGLSPAVARFQARSVWTGTGFTTAESEQIVKHPVRRRIVSLLMIVRSAGVVTAMAALILSFVDSPSDDVRSDRFLIIAGGLVVLWLVSISRSPRAELQWRGRRPRLAVSLRRQA